MTSPLSSVPETTPQNTTPAADPFAGIEPAAEPASRVSTGDLQDRVFDAMRTVVDPEIGANIVDIGLIYDVSISDEGAVGIDMTLTSPACPVAGSMPGDVERAVSAVEGVAKVNVNLVWTPPWTPELMGEAVKLQLGLF
jgi:FeS assembly SUF system protein